MSLFSLAGKNAVVLGGAGVLGASISEGLAAAGANVAIADIALEQSNALAERIRAEVGVKAAGYEVNAMSRESLSDVAQSIARDFGQVDVLVNAVGGNRKGATTSPETCFFDLPSEEIEKVVQLNLFGGALLPAQIFGKDMAANVDGGAIIHISSMNAMRPLTRIPGYSAAKAAVSNFTQWLAVDLARCGYTKVRVNAVAPGFFLTQQNRFLLTDEATGELTARGQSIIEHTPMSRFGSPDDLIGTIVWLASDASRFVTGIVVPVDGGFSAFSGV